MPHTHVRRQLTVFADPAELRILDGAVAGILGTGNDPGDKGLFPCQHVAQHSG